MPFGTWHPTRDGSEAETPGWEGLEGERLRVDQERSTSQCPRECGVKIVEQPMVRQQCEGLMTERLRVNQERSNTVSEGSATIHAQSLGITTAACFQETSANTREAQCTAASKFNGPPTAEQCGPLRGSDDDRVDSYILRVLADFVFENTNKNNMECITCVVRRRGMRDPVCP